ncbi:MAG: DUF4209 domain-containing protein, partial [Oscillospiraceae bacterium]|nr:DUF4209 domain-containing protein [Oscillospiraceae bacterium]
FASPVPLGTPATVPIDYTTKSHTCTGAFLFDAYEQLIENKGLKESLIILTLFTPILNKDKQREETIATAKQSILRGLTTLQITDKNGKVVAKIPPLNGGDSENEIAILEMHMHRDMSQSQQLQGHFLGILIAIIQRKHKFSIEDLDFIFDNNMIVPDDRIEIIKHGLYLGLSGSYYAALHLLAPQMENIFREIARECGAIVTTYDATDHSEQAKTLGSVFELQELVDSYDENILFTLKGLLNEKAGANLRNRVAHGILDTSEGSRGVAIYFICLCLKIFSWYSDESYSILVEALEEQTP